MRKKVLAATEENRCSLKKRLMAVFSMLMVAVIMTVTTSYAWLVLSIAPEVTGITTTIGANGSLEIALLSKDTFSDPNTVQTPGVGMSLSNNNSAANYTWGNMVDLNDKSYGLQDITLYPARLNIKGTAGNYTVDRNEGMLLIPSYGSDGRISTLKGNTVTGSYDQKGSFYSYADAQYGVRAIGNAFSYSVQSSALNQAKKNISTYASSAITAAKGSVSGDAVQNLLLKFATGDASFTVEDIEVLEAMIADLTVAEDYIEDALRQGLVAVAASAVAEEAQFTAVQAILLDKSTSIRAILNSDAFKAFGSIGIPDQFMDWVNAHASMENNLTTAANKCVALKSDIATADKAAVKAVLDYLMNLDKVLVGDKNFSDMTKDDLMGMVATGIELTLAPGSGIFATIADFAGNYSAQISGFVSMKTASAGSSNLALLLAFVNTLSAADGGSTAADVKLENLYGYVLDLAFRCNAFQSDLLLQTAGTQRIYDDSESDSTLGGGSYMEFTTMDGIDAETLTKLMDAVRVAFVDDAGNLLGIAKLNVSNRVVDLNNGTVKAPLYLYDFTIGTDPVDIGKLIMGERSKIDNVLTSLERNLAKAVSTLVWLDGDTVDNTMVAAESSISGVLNLQFASSVDLIPAGNTELLEYVTNKEGLTQAVTAAESIYNAGQGDYTTVSWNNYTTAYRRAKSVVDNANASDYAIYNSVVTLTEAKNALQKVDAVTFKAEVKRLRQWMGTTADDACLIASYNNGLPVLLTTYTQEQADNGYGWIKSVGYTEMRDEGNGLQTPIYTDSSWYNLARALYFAEALVARGGTLTDQEIDAALTRMQVAYDALDYAVYFTAYELNGAIYYKAYPADETDLDTYGTWYDYNLKRVLSELKILELDAYAVETTVAYMYDDRGVAHDPACNGSVYCDCDVWVDHNSGKIYPYVGLGLSNQEIRGVYWSIPEGLTPAMTWSQAERIFDLYMLLRDNHPDNADVKAAKEMVCTVYTEDENGQWIEDFLPDYYTTYEEATSVLEGLLELKAADDEANQVPEDPDAVKLMTPEQKIMLNKAIINAEEIANGINTDGIEDEAQKQAAVDKKTALIEKKDAAQAVLVKEDATYEEAQLALDELNEKIAGYDAKKQATEYNTIELSVPDSFGADDVIYLTEWEADQFINDAPVGSEFTLTAKIITDGGVLCYVERTYRVYEKAAWMEWVYAGPTPTDATINVGDTYEAGGYLAWHECNNHKPGNETVYEVTYYTSDGDVLVCDGGSSFTAVGPGTVEIYAAVKTVQGNTYTAKYPVTVTVEEPVEEPVAP